MGLDAPDVRCGAKPCRVQLQLRTFGYFLVVNWGFGCVSMHGLRLLSSSIMNLFL